MRNGEERVALMTEANRGLGFETARQLLAKGLYPLKTTNVQNRRLTTCGVEK